MIARQIAIGFGIAVLVPLLIFYGVSTVSPRPQFQDYVRIVGFDPHATPQERQATVEKRQAEQKAFKEAQSHFASRLFYVSAPLGYVAMLVGGFMAVSAVGTGLIFGGIFSVINGYWNYWAFIADWQRFVSLVIAAVVLLLIAYRKAPNADEKSGSA